MSLFNYSHKQNTRREIEAEIQRLSTALEDLRHKSGSGAGHQLDTLREKAESFLQGLHLGEQGGHLTHSTRDAGRMASECVRRHPLTTLAVAAGACALVGYLVTRR